MAVRCTKCRNLVSGLARKMLLNFEKQVIETGRSRKVHKECNGGVIFVGSSQISVEATEGSLD